jgi:hypothetical protein
MAAMTMKTKVTELPILAAIENASLDYVREYSDPLLVSAYMTLLPFKDVIGSVSAGPQKGENEQSHILIGCDDATPGLRLLFEIYADRVVMHVLTVCKDGEELADPPKVITLPDLWEILRNLPRSAYSYVRRGK